MIVITTPTGQIGRQVLDTLLDSGEPIRVVARDPSRLSRRARERVEVVEGSHGDSDVLAKACTGADRVFWLVPPDPTAASVEHYYLGFTRSLRAAISDQGVQRVVAVSSLGRGAARGAGHISAALAMDELIESTGVHYRALCPPGFMENMLMHLESIRREGVFRWPMSGQRKVPTCSTRDIAAVASRLLLDGSWTGQRDVPIHGPENLSYDDMARIMSEVLKRPIRYEQVPAAAFAASLTWHGMTAAWAQGLADMVAQVDQGIYDAVPRTPESTTPTTFRQWCEEVLEPAVEV